MEKNNAISSDLIRGHIDTIILHTLLDGDKFAGQIIDYVDKKSSGEYIMNQATLYSSLKRLETLKQVSSYWFDSDGGRRKYFKITDLGKKTVEENLDNWSFSRGIIDKLMDVEPQIVYKTQYIEVEKPVVKEVSVTDTTSPSNSVENVAKNAVLEPVLSANDKTFVLEKEINYKSVLDEIFKENIKDSSKLDEVIPIEESKSIEISVEVDKPKLNDTLVSDKYNAPIESNVGKMDFGDIVLKATTEGYKVKISSKDLGAPVGKLFINKLKAFSSIAVYLLILIEVFLLSVKYGGVFDFTGTIGLAIIGAFALFPIVNIFHCIFNPKKKSHKTINVDVILTALIVVFNLILVIFAGNLLFETDFTNLSDILKGIIIPSLLCVDILAYYVIKYFVAKLNYFKVK